MRFTDLQEGPNDPGIFKAIFLAGGPGSGKSYVTQQLGLQSRGLRVINSDDAFEYLMRKQQLSFDMPPEEQPGRDVARSRAKDITGKKQNLYLDGRLGLIIDGTAKDPNKMAALKAELDAIGYQTMMVFVNTSLRTALQRNLLRPRKVPSEIVIKSHEQVQKNKSLLSDVFAPNYIEVNNDNNATFGDPLRKIDKFLREPITAKAKDWVSKAQLQKTVTQEDVQGKPKVYVDMDGVLANFYAGVTRVTGHEEPRDMALQDIEDTMASFKGTDFFYKLPKYEQTDQLIAMVNAATKGDWYILSSPLKYDREGSAKYKAAWVKDFLKIQPKEMHFMSDKAQFATQPDGTPNILIDDYPKYLNSWKDKGGIGVQYKGHAGNISDVKATLDQYFSKKKVAEETRQPGEYVYHASYVGDDKARWLRSLNQRGLRPSGHGYSGPGTYFAYKPDEGYYHVTPEDSMILRVKWKDLVSLFGVYPANPSGIERDDDEIIVPGTVPASMIEVEYFDNEWWDLKSALDTETHQFETIRKVDGGYRLLSKKGKNLGTYPSKSGAEKRERQVQYFKHVGEARRSSAVEPDTAGYQHSNLTSPQNTLVIDKSDDMDFYKLGQHYTSLANYDKHELGVGPSDMTITFFSPEEMERMKKVFDKLGVAYKDIGGSHEQPEIHTKPPEGKVAEALDSSYPYKNSKRNPGNDFYFGTEDGQEYKVQFDIVDDDVTVAFSARGQGDEHKTGITGTGNSRKIFGTVIKIVKDYIRKSNPGIIAFSANNSEPSRVRLYKMLASQATKELPNYNFTDAFSNGGFTTYYLTRDGAKIPTSTKVKAKAGKVLDKVFDSQQPKLPGRLFSALSEVADSPYDFVRNVKTPDKRAYRFQTDAGLMYRVQVFNRRKDDTNKLEIHFDLTDTSTGKPETGKTGTGDAVRVFSTVANILQQEVTDQDPTGIIIASKADDESRVKLYRTLARRAAKLMPGYEVTRERQVTGGDGNPYLTIELAKK
jgi:predicted kinase